MDGATITFIDINKFKNIQEKIQSALNYAEDIINTVREPLIVLDQNLKWSHPTIHSSKHLN